MVNILTFYKFYPLCVISGLFRAFFKLQMIFSLFFPAQGKTNCQKSHICIFSLVSSIMTLCGNQQQAWDRISGIEYVIVENTSNHKTLYLNL